MKKFLFAFFLLIILQAPIPTFAHDLLPKQIVEYLASHPDATAEEIQAYAQTQDRAVASQFSSEEAVIRLVRNQHTNIWDNTLDFVVLGVKHILSGPDHILFVFGFL